MKVRVGLSRVRTVPAARMKGGKETSKPHRLPLSAEALRVVEGQRVGAALDSPFVLPSVRRPQRAAAIDKTAVWRAWRALVPTGETLHGIRSTFTDWAAEIGRDEVVAEKCLAHQTGTTVRRPWQRSDLLGRRRELMQSWVD